MSTLGWAKALAPRFAADFPHHSAFSRRIRIGCLAAFRRPDEHVEKGDLRRSTYCPHWAVETKKPSASMGRLGSNRHIQGCCADLIGSYYGLIPRQVFCGGHLSRCLIFTSGTDSSAGFCCPVCDACRGN